MKIQTKNILESGDSLDHEQHESLTHSTTVHDIKELVLELDQKHFLERKVKFLLDIRGYLKLNDIKGNYVEFGSYKSEMQYAAYEILNSTHTIEKYIGLDTFKGEPTLRLKDRAHAPHLEKEQFSASYQETEEFVKKYLGDSGFLIKGDFRHKKVVSKLDSFDDFSVVVIDCNLLSSIEAALNYIIPRTVPGGLIFIDDFYVNCSQGKLATEKAFSKILKKYKKKGSKHSFYAPFAHSFIITD
tara:strand:- start:1020 stop:1748 length:729 start_codon:yes stop_codon:yes gene_type:complete